MAVYRQIGFVAGMIYWFENLMGRYTLLVLNGGLATLEARDSGWVLLLWVLLWWGALVGVAYEVLARWRPGVPQRWGYACVFAHVFLLLVLLTVPDIATTLYWQAGINGYLLALTLFTVMVAAVLRLARHPALWVQALFIAALVLLVGISEIMTVVAAAMLIGLALWRGMPQGVRRLAWIGLACTVLCFAVVAFAGGTLNRASNGLTTAQSGDLGFAVAVTVSSLGSPMLVTILNAPLAYAAWVLIAWLLGYCHPMALTLQTRKRLLLWVIGVLVLTAAAIGLPFIPIAYFVGTGLVVHMWILPMFAWLVGSGVVAWLFGRLMAGYRVRVLGVRSRALVVIALVAFWLTALPIAWQARMTQATYAQAWDERHQAIQAVLAGNTVTPASDVLDSPYDKIRRPDAADDPNLRPLVMASLRGVSPFRWEVVADPQNFANQCVAAYYGVAQVVAAADGG
jgi:hypothetical protein